MQQFCFCNLIIQLATLYIAYIWCENFETLGPTLSNLKNFSIPSFSFGNRVIKFSMIFSLLDTNGNLLTFPFIGSPIATFKNAINLYETHRYMLWLICEKTPISQLHFLTFQCTCSEKIYIFIEIYLNLVLYNYLMLEQSINQYI